MHSTAPRVSIVIPLFNRCDLTLACLQALESNTPPTLYEVVIVDNASTDDTAQLLDAIEGDVTIIRNPENLGFAKACNQGAAAARGELLCFLNNDTEVTPGWLEALVGHLDAEPGVAAVGARLLYPNGTVQHAGVLLVENEGTGYLEVHHRAHGQPGDSPEALTEHEPVAVTGAAMVVRAEAFAAAEGFDEGYWNGYEDIDLCLTLRASGWRIAYVPGATIVHHESASGPERHVGMPEGGRRFTARWKGRFTADAIRDGDSARPAPQQVQPDNPEPELTGALVRLAQKAIRQQGEPLRFAGRDARMVMDRLTAEAVPAGERPLVSSDLVATAGRLADGTDIAKAEAIRSRIEQAEERRLLAVMRAGRDVCWLDEGVDEPLVTIAIPTYNRGQMVVDRAIGSALAQTYRNIEVLVVGDNCDEATERAVRAVEDPRVRFVNLPARGIYPEDAMHKWMVAGTAPANAAIELAQGSWLTQCDDDDEFTPDHVEVLLRAAREQRLELIYSQARMEFAPGHWGVLGSEPLRHGQITHGSVLYSLGLRFFRYSNTAWKLEEPGDWNMWRRMAAAGVRVGFLPQVTYVHYVESHQRRDEQPAAAEAPVATAVPAPESELVGVGAARGGSSNGAAPPPVPGPAPVGPASGPAPSDPDRVLVQLGCGPNKLAGWTNVDVDPMYEPELICDLSRGLPLPDDSVDVVYSEHFFEHLDLADGMRLLGSIHRCLKPGGVIRIAMPDLAEVIRQYLGDWRSQVWLQDRAYDYIDTAAHMINVSFREWGHRYLYDAEDIRRRLDQSGFVDVRQVAWGESDVDVLRGRETRPESQLVAEARKPG